MKVDPETRRKIEAAVATDLATNGLANLPKPAKRKYKNTPTWVEGVWFASKKEAVRWRELKLLEANGKITDLRRQVRFVLSACREEVVNGRLVRVRTPVTSYVADACYNEHGVPVVEDVKSVATVTEVYRIKRAWMAAEHGVEIREV